MPAPTSVMRSPRTITTWLASIVPERASNRCPARMATTWSRGARYLPAVCARAGMAANPAIPVRITAKIFNRHVMEFSPCPQFAGCELDAFYTKFAGSGKEACYSGRVGMISQVTRALANDRPAQMNISTLNPKTKALEIDARITPCVPASSPEGKSRPASLISFD